MKFEHEQDGTRYVLWRVATFATDEDGQTIWCVETGFGSGHGQWVMLGAATVAWSYLVEKMPGLRWADKPGLVALFAKAGLEVFG